MPTDGIPAEVSQAPFPYMRWAKRYLPPGDPQSLGLSGAPRPTDAPGAGGVDAPESDPGLELKTAIAARAGLTPEHVHLSGGSSAANFSVYHTLARGGRIAVETPAYQALHVLAPAVGATLTTFTRTPGGGARIDPASLAAAVETGVDLIVVTDLHNPSGKCLHPDDLALLIKTAEAKDAHVLVDEVYLDFDLTDRPTSALQSDRIVVTNSLTKCHGYGDLRAGWILAAPDIARRIEAQDDIINPVLPRPALLAALAVFPTLDRVLKATRAKAQVASDTVDAWVQQAAGVSWGKPDGGLTGLIQLPLDGTRFCEHLLAEHGFRAVPGAFFQERNSVRVSYLLPPETLDLALLAMQATLLELTPSQ